MVQNIVGGVDAKTYCLFWILIGIIEDIDSKFCYASASVTRFVIMSLPNYIKTWLKSM